MIMRYRWYRLKSPISHSSLLDLMMNEEITSEKNQGYSLLHSENKEITFRFFWRVKITTTRLDQDGETFHEELFTLNSQDCTLTRTGDKYLLRLENPGRSSRELFNSLEELMGMGFYSKALVLSNENINELLKKLDISKLTGIKLTGGVENNEMVARIDLASKKGIILENLPMLEGVKYKIDSASYEIMTKGTKGNFSYTPTGLVRISGQLSPMLLALIESIMLNKV
ncbi:hypothetical protein ACYTTR_00845 [Cobetia marina]